MLLRAQPTRIMRKKGGAVMYITTLGIDLAKNVFQLHGVDARGQSAEDHALRVPVCGRWFYARDLRQQYCSPECGKEGRWTRYWQTNREKINRRRRKGSVS